ncbi:NADH-ubiquinone oxidoreductase-F iron-sulfur binding region domain-containing protein [Maioricimonas sp. JC845]|uniref:NADH-ubiquinone oxidoreductase-F iron-sulfur binding region domain-containing protein n=1 Tax=Maioricimonas sp. JC845 TaxID=3232138 RepID=UPI003458C7DC
MELLRELMRRQDQTGFLDDATLRDISEEHRVPLYRLQGLVSFYPHFRRTPPPRVTLQVCRDIACRMQGSPACVQRLEQSLSDQDGIEIEEVSCLGRCDAAPAAAINEVPLAPTTLADDETVRQLLATPPAPLVRTPSGRDWQCNPYASPTERYSTVRELVAGGQLAEVCIERLQASGLRGMGGAGFPTGKKWEIVAGEPATPKYVICNADECEPGTFKDREILADLSHLVIEGMLLAGLTIGAERGIVYIRHEYGGERQALEAALERARAEGILGDNAADSGQPFDIEVFVSPGGYILGEETALLEALEDKRGEPRNKPPYPGQHGLWGQPTLINNVETLALATTIIHNGPDWWADQGEGDTHGLKFISVSGDVTNPGVYEIPLGMTVQEVIDLAGGMRDGIPLKAFLPGGASTAFLPASAADTPLTFDALRASGSALGTGAVIVLNQDRDLFDLATSLVRFFRNESCGKCVPCRLGSQTAVELLEGVADGEQPASRLDVLPDLGETLQQTSICGLGQVALTPILSMLRHFPDEGVLRGER